MPRFLWFFAVLLCTAANAPARAWGNQGHMASGSIAYDLLARDHSETIATVVALMAHHPDRERFESALGDLTGPARDRALFALIARWPDDIRKTRYNRTHWHHEYQIVSGWTLLSPIRLGVLRQALRKNWRLVHDTRADPGRRAVALCWLFHLTGDMQQPLHAGHRMDARFPLSDRGGTRSWVHGGVAARALTFHYFWDTAADQPGDDSTGAALLAQRIGATRPPWAPTMPDPDLWYRESRKLAARHAYHGAGMDAAPRPGDAPILPDEYLVAARAVAEARIGQAGERIADLAVTLPVAA